MNPGKTVTAQHYFFQMIQDRQRGEVYGITSVCSAHPTVLRAAMAEAREADMPVLSETTANQVNQFGGYTGMRPADFIDEVKRIALACDFPADRILFGGDHLGPLVWQDRPAEEAMALAEELIRAFVAAGFGKIHIDTSMRLGGDNPEEPLSNEVIAQRGTRLCAVAEEAFLERYEVYPGACPPVYVIGSEVPTPGGHQPQESGLQVTSPEDFLQSLAAFQETFLSEGLADAWTRVIAFVVQPGVEFDGKRVYPYDRAASASLTAALDNCPRLVFEGHSTDYQTPAALRQLVEDGVAILKVGPALTFFHREALMALEHIEAEMVVDPARRSKLSQTLETVMRTDDRHWRAHYQGNEQELRLERRYSFFDRVRYYWSQKQVEEAVACLLENLEKTGIPLPLLSQYLPQEYACVCTGVLRPRPRALVESHIRTCLRGYTEATIRRI